MMLRFHGDAIFLLFLVGVSYLAGFIVGRRTGK